MNPLRGRMEGKERTGCIPDTSRNMRLFTRENSWDVSASEICTSGNLVRMRNQTHAQKNLNNGLQSSFIFAIIN